MKRWKNSHQKLLIIHKHQFFSLLAWLPKRPILGRNRKFIGSPCLLSTIFLVRMIHFSGYINIFNCLNPQFIPKTKDRGLQQIQTLIYMYKSRSISRKVTLLPRSFIGSQEARAKTSWNEKLALLVYTLDGFTDFLSKKMWHLCLPNQQKSNLNIKLLKF